MPTACKVPTLVKYSQLKPFWTNSPSQVMGSSKRMPNASKNNRAEPPIAYCALRYLLLWEQQERILHEAMRGFPSGADLRKVLHNYRVARTFKGIGKRENAERVLDKLRAIGDDNSLTPVAKVESLTEEFTNDFEKSNLSAATKLLWLRYRGPYRIYDARAVRALKCRGRRFNSRNYGQYAEAWQLEFHTKQVCIDSAIDLLPGLQPFLSQWHETTTSIRQLTTQQWFQERIFDIYLWELGAADK